MAYCDRVTFGAHNSSLTSMHHTTSHWYFVATCHLIFATTIHLPHRIHTSLLRREVFVEPMYFTVAFLTISCTSIRSSKLVFPWRFAICWLLLTSCPLVTLTVPFAVNKASSTSHSNKSELLYDLPYYYACCVLCFICHKIYFTIISYIIQHIFKA